MENLQWLIREVGFFVSDLIDCTLSVWTVKKEQNLFRYNETEWSKFQLKRNCKVLLFELLLR